VNRDLSNIPPELRASLEEKMGTFPYSGLANGDVPIDSLPVVWACSDFVAAACLRDETLLPWLFSEGRLQDGVTEDSLNADLESELDPADDEAHFMDELRRFRRRQLVRIAWRDIAGCTDVETILAELSLLADVCIRAACRRARDGLVARHGIPRGEDGAPLELMVLGMGKLGGGELNFSSDIDLVFLFPAHGETDGARPLEHEEYFARWGRKVAQLLGTVTAEGFVYRVDLRLRPFGESGPQVVSFDAFEDYLQQHGRDWERYAYVKARPVFGDGPFAEL
jgi:glutamate-ammonia-ligase adenylyltransferase